MKNNIKHRRKDLQISQEYLAEQMNVSRQSIISIEKGKYNPSLELAYRISKFFGATIEEVFLFEDNHHETTKGRYR
ncbi:helix-turn-helix transcriptional regulator [Salicibibacter cibi]|uniref:Helix-turn-helix transcriptional regulator n=1 Tax=Salicibibacter cibi TaxID=2743001 RepID=A0A7T6ZAX5_9BACI|nr:helix-turn-helix transcriptional regulator [Salicibibacter cibi]QQK79900.1 helix-turn-helix transcriptional regulator [Salicibibacter cibi]